MHASRSLELVVTAIHMQEGTAGEEISAGINGPADPLLSVQISHSCRNRNISLLCTRQHNSYVFMLWDNLILIAHKRYGIALIVLNNYTGTWCSFSIFCASDVRTFLKNSLEISHQLLFLIKFQLRKRWRKLFPKYRM